MSRHGLQHTETMALLEGRTITDCCIMGDIRRVLLKSRATDPIRSDLKRSEQIRSDLKRSERDPIRSEEIRTDLRVQSIPTSVVSI